MKLTQTQNGKIIVTRLTRNGSQERIGTLATNLTLKEAKAAYHSQIEEIERLYNSQPNARHKLREAIRHFCWKVVYKAERIQEDWNTLVNMDADQVTKNYSFGEASFSWEAAQDNALVNLINDYMDVTGLDYDTAEKQLMNNAIAFDRNVVSNDLN